MSDTPAVPFVPPKRIVLEDTGERRFPQGNEVYVYLHPSYVDGGGLLSARLSCADDYDDWDGDPSHFAIYRIAEVTA